MNMYYSSDSSSDICPLMVPHTFCSYKRCPIREGRRIKPVKRRWTLKEREEMK